MSCALLLWFVLLHVWAFCSVTQSRPSSVVASGFGLYVCNLIALILLSLLVLQ